MKLVMTYFYLPLIFFLDVAFAMEPIKNQDDNSHFYESIRKNDIEGIQRFYRNRESNNGVGDYEDPLVYAARVGSTASLTFLLNSFYNDERSRLSKNQALVAASFNGSVKSMEALLLAGADKNYVADGDINPLWASIEGGHPDAFRYLLSIGASYKYINTKGENLLFPAVISGDLEIIKILMSLGLNSKIIIMDGKKKRDLKDYASYRWKDTPNHLSKIIELIGTQ